MSQMTPDCLAMGHSKKQQCTVLEHPGETDHGHGETDQGHALFAIHICYHSYMFYHNIGKANKNQKYNSQRTQGQFQTLVIGKSQKYIFLTASKPLLYHS